MIQLRPSIGEFVPAGGPLATIHGPHPERLDRDGFRRALVLGQERTLDQDVAFGVRMLVDMGLKALADSPLPDPSTTVQVIDRIHDILRQLSGRQLADSSFADADGIERLVMHTMDWPDYVQLAFEELRLAGGESPQVTRRLRASLDDLLDVAPEDRRGPLLEQLELLDARIDRLAEDDHDRAIARQPDPLGLGDR